MADVTLRTEKNDAALRGLWEAFERMREHFSGDAAKLEADRAALDAVSAAVEAAGPLAGAYRAVRDEAFNHGLFEAFDGPNGWMVAYSPETFEAAWIDLEAGRVVSREAVTLALIERIFKTASEHGNTVVSHTRTCLENMGPFEGPRYGFDVDAFLASFPPRTPLRVELSDC